MTVSLTSILDLNACHDKSIHCFYFDLFYVLIDNSVRVLVGIQIYR